MRAPTRCSSCGARLGSRPGGSDNRGSLRRATSAKRRQTHRLRPTVRSRMLPHWPFLALSSGLALFLPLRSWAYTDVEDRPLWSFMICTTPRVLPSARAFCSIPSAVSAFSPFGTRGRKNLRQSWFSGRSSVCSLRMNVMEKEFCVNRPASTNSDVHHPWRLPRDHGCTALCPDGRQT